MTTVSNRSAVLVTSHPGQTGSAELKRLASSGEAPRKDYVELARLLEADVIDSHYMDSRAAPLARAVAARAGLPAGQITEAFLRRGRYQHVCVWSDKVGLPLALLYKLARSRRDMALISAWSSDAKKAVFLRRLKVHSHLGAMINDSSLQMEIAASRLGVPRDKLYLLPQPVDDRFWRPDGGPVEDLICSVGLESRDYSTLVNAMRGLDLNVDLVVGSIVLSGDATGPVGAAMREVATGGLPPNVRLRHKLPWKELRALYGRSRFVVIPMRDVEYNAGVTALVEAMAMGKAVVVTRTRGLADLIRDGEQGIYVPPGDATALREAVEYLAAHPEEAARMGRAGRALVEERHTMDACIARLTALVRGDADAAAVTGGMITAETCAGRTEASDIR